MDVIAVLGLLTSIEQPIEATTKVVNHAMVFYPNSKELPKTLEEVRTIYVRVKSCHETYFLLLCD